MTNVSSSKFSINLWKSLDQIITCQKTPVIVVVIYTKLLTTAQYVRNYLGGIFLAVLTEVNEEGVGSRIFQPQRSSSAAKRYQTTNCIKLFSYLFLICGTQVLSVYRLAFLGDLSCTYLWWFFPLECKLSYLVGNSRQLLRSPELPSCSTCALQTDFIDKLLSWKGWNEQHSPLGFFSWLPSLTSAVWHFIITDTSLSGADGYLQRPSPVSMANSWWKWVTIFCYFNTRQGDDFSWFATEVGPLGQKVMLHWTSIPHAVHMLENRSQFLFSLFPLLLHMQRCLVTMCGSFLPQVTLPHSVQGGAWASMALSGQGENTRCWPLCIAVTCC